MTVVQLQALFEQIIRDMTAGDGRTSNSNLIMKLSHVHEGTKGDLGGQFSVFMRLADKGEILLHRESFVGVSSREDIMDVAGRVLSVVLMNHPEWPKVHTRNIDELG